MSSGSLRDRLPLFVLAGIALAVVVGLAAQRGRRATRTDPTPAPAPQQEG